MSNYWTFENKLRKGQPEPCVSFFGEEAYLHRRAIDLLKKVVLNDHADCFNYTMAYAEEVNLAEFLAQSRTASMLAGPKLMILRHCEKIGANQLPVLEYFLKQPSAKNIVLFDFSPDIELWRMKSSGGAGQKLHKMMLQHTDAFEFERFRQPQHLVQFLRNLAQEAPYRFEDDALKYLTDRLGGDLELIVQEMEKVWILIGAQGIIRQRDMEHLVGRHPYATIFDLINALARRDARQAMERLEVMLGQGEPHLYILSLLTRFFRQAMLYKSLVRQGKSRNEIKVAMNIRFDKPLDDLRLSHQNYRQQDLWACLQLIGKADQAFKSSRVNIRTHLEFLLLTICRTGQ
ncbi:MAG: DNA polymerase III subunit delta [Acidobacteria bacterium]|nr:DNA polymerase III subunit delta [Acidobacteriota bacterium]